MNCWFVFKKWHLKFHFFAPSLLFFPKMFDFSSCYFEFQYKKRIKPYLVTKMLKNGVIDCFHNVKMTLINFSIYFNHLNHFYNCSNDGRHLCVTFHAVRGRFQHVPRPFSACSRSFNWSLGPENESPRWLLRFGMRRFFVARLVPEISYFDIWVDFMLTSR